MFNKKRKLDTIKSEHLFYFIFLFLFSLVLFFSFSIRSYNLKNNLQKLSENAITLNYLENILNNNVFYNKKNEIIKNSLIKNTKNTFDKKYFQDINIIAKAYVVYDVNNDKIIYSKNENKVLPLASLTKVSSTITMLHIASSTEKIIIKKELMNKGDFLDIGLFENQE